MITLLVLAAIFFIGIGVWSIAAHGPFWGGLLMGGFSAINTGVEFLFSAIASIVSE